ncbi:hypothetical protein DUI87_15864 [Hirundo rustica rustica]|uniref:Uncharacterized protein n=1 Tax=Hirundo rustica rustica TaxID=333673 RepID=A0A3M0K5T1_HIRRU|nr:hypothetical protein DUI87_15864 [Hirundo rustica rustica]
MLFILSHRNQRTVLEERREKRREERREEKRREEKRREEKRREEKKNRRAIRKQYCEIHITMANAADAEREQMCWAKAWEAVLESQEPG